MADRKDVYSPLFTYHRNMCVGCSRHNPHGLKLSGMYLQDGWLCCPVNLTEHYSGFPGVVHGGIQATVLDEVMAWCIFSVLQKVGVTVDLQVRYNKPLKTDTPYLARARVIKTIKPRLIELYGEIAAADTVYSKARAHYYALPHEKAKNLLGEDVDVSQFTVQLRDPTA